MPQLPIYDLADASLLETAENRFDVLPLQMKLLSDNDRFCLAQTLNLARQRQKRRPLPAYLEQELRCSRNWAAERHEKMKRI